jgi:lysylphosphatidylglycerol synthetase-like protein (DUF2156 family)
MRRTLIRTLVGFVIAIAIVLALGGLFKLYTDTQLSEQKQQEVLIKAIPFVAVFVSIVIAFACVIVLVAIRFNGRVPQRTYRPIEMIIIAGILIGVVGLFQGWNMFAYEYGFLLLVVSVVAFMIWSHMNPLPARLSQDRPPLDRRAHIVAGVAGIIVWALVAAWTVSASEPVEPYGYSPTVWSYLEPEDQAQIVQDAEDEYQNARIPVMLLISLLPGALVYFAVRELVPPATQPSLRHVSTSQP